MLNLAWFVVEFDETSNCGMLIVECVLNVCGMFAECLWNVWLNVEWWDVCGMLKFVEC